MSGREFMFLLAGALLCRGLGLVWERAAADLRARRARRRASAILADLRVHEPISGRTYPHLPDVSGDASRVIELTRTKVSGRGGRR